MSNPVLQKAALASLDADLIESVTQGYMNVSDAIQLQILRILRGRPFNVEFQPKQDPAKAWSPDGKEWLPKAPGT